MWGAPESLFSRGPELLSTALVRTEKSIKKYTSVKTGATVRESLSAKTHRMTVIGKHAMDEEGGRRRAAADGISPILSSRPSQP